MEGKKTEKKQNIPEEKKDDVIEVPVGKWLDKIRNNPWMVSTIFLTLILVVVLVLNSGNGISGGVSAETAGQDILNFINSNPDLSGDVSVTSSVKEGSLYKVTLDYNGQEIPVYATLDGKYLVSNIVPLEIQEDTATGDTESQEVPKSDKPVVEAFIFSYCPYGLQFEKAMIPVYKLLKNKADINIVAIGAMHGEFEKTESLRQLCVQKEYGDDKMWNYLEKFAADTSIGNCNGDETCLTPSIQKIYTSLGIDKKKIDNCMEKDAEELYNTDMDRASSLGISGSPTFVINGVKVQVNRSPDAIKTAICDAFTTTPSECGQGLSTAAASAGFGSSTSASSSSASC